MQCEECGSTMRMVFISEASDLEVDFIPYQCLNPECSMRYQYQHSLSHLNIYEKITISLILALICLSVWLLEKL